eukprot:g2394.t1
MMFLFFLCLSLATFFVASDPLLLDERSLNFTSTHKVRKLGWGDCGRGKYCASETLWVCDCKSCQRGRYQDKDGHKDRECKFCPKGRYGATEGLTSDTCSGDCPKGTYGASTGLTSDSCSGDCPKGTYGASKGLTSNSCSGDCPKGTYGASKGLESCEECRKGRFGSTTGLTSDSCSGECPKGRYGSTTGLESDLCSGECPKGRYGGREGLKTRRCSGKCPLGRYGDSEGLETSDCSGKCPLGRYGATTGLTSEDCTDLCPTGTYSNSTGSTSSTCSGNCAAGRYNDEPGAPNCKLCPIGKYGGKMGLKTKSCSDGCSPGRFGNETGLTTKMCSGPCAPGRYGTGGSTNRNCTGLCHAGYFGEGGDEDPSCTDFCDPGKYSKEGAVTCERCPLGKTSKPRSTNVSECVHQCIYGEYWNETRQHCAECPKGRASMEMGIVHPDQCNNCTPGKYNDNSGEATCKLCEAGSYSKNLEATSCVKCEIGKYSIPGSPHCNECIPGFIATDSRDRCIPCDAGKYYDSSQKKCKVCETAKFSYSGSTACNDCPGGTFGNSRGASNASCNGVCSVGKYSLSGSTECLPCPFGKYNDKTRQKLCEDCPAGKSNNNTGSVSIENCNKCQKGRYSQKGAVLCEKCPGGKYGTVEGAISESSCLTCERGRFADKAGGHTECEECAVNQIYCAAGSSKEYQCDDNNICNGTHKVERPKDTPEHVIATKRGINTLLVTWKLGQQNERINSRFLLSYKNDLEDPKILSYEPQNTKHRILQDGMVEYEFLIDADLHVGTVYYVSVQLVENTPDGLETKSKKSPMSQGVEFKCPNGAYCGPLRKGGVSLNSTRNMYGYFRVNDSLYEECLVKSNCPGIEVDDDKVYFGTESIKVPFNTSMGEILDNGNFSCDANKTVCCPVGHRGTMCLKCKANYVNQDDKCERCKGLWVQAIYLVACIIFVFVSLVYVIWKTIQGHGSPRDVQTGILKIALRQFQTASIVATFPLEWGIHENLKHLFDGISVATELGSGVFSTDCFVEQNYLSNLIIFACLVVFVYFSLIVFWTIWSFKDATKLYRRIVMTTVIITLFVQPILGKKLLEIYPCTDEIGDVKYVRADVDIHCHDSEHMGLLYFISLPGLVLFFFMIPLLIRFIVWRHRADLGDTDIRETYGFLYSHYEGHTYYWESVIILRLMLVVMVSAIWSSRPQAQVILISIILTIFLYFHMLYRPYVSDMLDDIEALSLLCSLITLLSGSLLFNDSNAIVLSGNPVKVGASYLIFIVQLGFLSFIIYRLIYVTDWKKLKDHYQVKLNEYNPRTIMTLSKLKPINQALLKNLLSIDWIVCEENEQFTLMKLPCMDGEGSRSIAMKITYFIDIPLKDIYETLNDPMSENDTLFKEPSEDSTNEDMAYNEHHFHKYRVLHVNIPGFSDRVLAFETRAQSLVEDGFAVVASSTTPESIKNAPPQFMENTVLARLLWGGYLLEEYTKGPTLMTKVTYGYCGTPGASFVPQPLLRRLSHNIVVRGRQHVLDLFARDTSLSPNNMGQTPCDKLFKFKNSDVDEAALLSHYQRRRGRVVTSRRNPVVKQNDEEAANEVELVGVAKMIPRGLREKESEKILRRHSRLARTHHAKTLTNPMFGHQDLESIDGDKELSMTVSPMLRGKVDREKNKSIYRSANNKLLANALMKVRKTKEWKKYTDDSSGNPYWYNEKTGVSSWENPYQSKSNTGTKQKEKEKKKKTSQGGNKIRSREKSMAVTLSPLMRKTKPNATYHGWQEYFDNETGKPYWHNHVTNQTTWDRPKTISLASK